MKNSASVFVIIVLLSGAIVSCNKNNPAEATVPTAVPSPAVTPDNALYGFETGTIMNWSGVSGGVTNTAISTVNVYRGAYSLRVDGNFNAGGDNWLGVSPPSVTNMLGKKIIMRVFVPAGKPSIAGSIFVQDGASWCWERSAWTSIPAGSWKTLEFDLAYPEYSCGNNPDASDVHRLGFQFQPGTSQAYSIYIDSVEIVSAGTPTHTPTVSPTHSVSPTVTPTITGTPPTATVSPTITQTPTLISTPQRPDDANIQYYGRWNNSDPLNPKCGWGANYIVAGFEGTSIAINISSQWDDWYAYGIDDLSDHNTFTKFRVRTGRDAGSALPTQTPYVITGLAEGSHTIVLVRRSEGTSGVDTFKGFGLDTGKTLTAPAPAAPTRKMEFI
ncbi:MAG TPA: hypothetical protein P5511_08530, partial [Candidatus Goldiibacteriota bacterium]|nr:hypothetical protein [Candidatus Goldiibacteriota bacterium]